MEPSPPAYPTLLAYRRSPHLYVWCEHCRAWHLHGAGGDTPGAGDGHRVAHCGCRQSPYVVNGGYILKEVGRFSESMPVYRQTREARLTRTRVRRRRGGVHGCVCEG